MQTEMLGDLLINIYKNLKTTVEKELKAYGIGMGQLQILMAFFDNLEKSFVQNELVGVIGVDKGNISRSVLKLLDKGYLMQNEEQKSYQLSEKGLQLKAEIMPIFIKINLLMTNSIAAKDISQTISTLSTVSKNLEVSK